MSDREQIAALGRQPAPLAAGDYLAPIGDDPAKPGRAGHVRSAEDGVYAVSWFDEEGDFIGHQVGSLQEVMERCQRIPGPRPTTRREQPAPIPGTGDVWQEVIDGLDLDDPIRPICLARQALGRKNYGTPLQRGNGRDEARDTDEELADVLVYARAEYDDETMEDAKRALRRRLRRREGR